MNTRPASLRPAFDCPALPVRPSRSRCLVRPNTDSPCFPRLRTFAHRNLTSIRTRKTPLGRSAR